MQITGEMKIVSWCDEDYAKVQSIIDSINEYVVYHINALKKNSACIRTKQATDLCIVFL